MECSGCQVGRNGPATGSVGWHTLEMQYDMSVLSGDRTYTFQSCVAPPSCSCKGKCGFGWLLGLLWCFSCILAHMYSQVCIRTFFGNVDATLPIQIGMTRDVRVSRFSRFCTQKVERSYPAECWHGRCSYSCDQNRRYAPDQA